MYWFQYNNTMYRAGYCTTSLFYFRLSPRTYFSLHKHRNDRCIELRIDIIWVYGPPGSNWCFSFAPELVGYSAPRDLHRRAAYSVCESWFLIHQDVYHDLFVCS